MRPDYAASGIDIQHAMITEAKRLGARASLPLRILWNGKEIQTGDRFDVPKRGRVRIEFVSEKTQPRQGIDIEVPKGKITIPDGSTVSHLRTWNDPDLSKTVEYPFQTRDGALWVSNVYQVSRGSVTFAERWTSLAGMIVNIVSKNERVYHCSPGGLKAPDFECLVVKVSIHT